jgi:hypothetical protein
MDLLPTNAAHWHLVLNHLPIVGSLAALLLVAWGFIKNTDESKRIALTALVLVALVAIPAFLTGEPSERYLKGLQGVSKRAMSAHEDLAEKALWLAVGAGAAALGVLLFFRKARSIPRWTMGVLLLLTLLVCGAMWWTGKEGGRIRHSEIRTNPGQESPVDVEH